MTNPFTGLKNRVVELKIEDKKIKVIPKVKDAEMFITLKRELSEKDAEKVTGIITGMIQRAYPDADKDDLSAFVTKHYGSFMQELAILFGFATRKDFQDLMKRIER